MCSDLGYLQEDSLDTSSSLLQPVNLKYYKTSGETNLIGFRNPNNIINLLAHLLHH
jgi:hypothetical protein